MYLPKFMAKVVGELRENDGSVGLLPARYPLNAAMISG
jgi:hypothetical protein